MAIISPAVFNHVVSLSSEGEAVLKAFEGWRSRLYKCPGGAWTIGWGHRVWPVDMLRFKGGINKATGQVLFEGDVLVAESAITNFVHVPLMQCHVDALISFIFNVGAEHFRTSTALRRINEGLHAEVPAQLQRWVYSGGKRLKGLERRRAIEAKMYAGDYGMWSRGLLYLTRAIPGLNRTMNGNPDAVA